MLRRAMVAIVGLGLSACFIDASGGAPSDKGEPFSTVTSTAVGTATSSSGMGGSGGAGGGGPVPVCGDGLVSGEEACEDGNSDPGDGCLSCTLEASCGNGLIEPGEVCDGAGGCQPDCQLPAGSLCAAAEGAIPLLAGINSGTIDASSPAAIGSFSALGCVVAEDRPSEIFFYASAPYPEGLYVSAAFDSPSDDMVLFAHQGCGDVPVACEVEFSRASFDLGILPPQSQLFLGVADYWGTVGSFQLYARPYRYRDSFQDDPGWALSGDWYFDDFWDELGIAGDGSAQTLTSSEIYIAGIPTALLVESRFGSDGGPVDVGVSYDGGAPIAAGQLADLGGGGYSTSRLTVPIPAGAQTATIAFTTSEDFWLTHLTVGPEVASE